MQYFIEFQFYGKKNAAAFPISNKGFLRFLCNQVQIVNCLPTRSRAKLHHDYNIVLREEEVYSFDYDFFE